MSQVYNKNKTKTRFFLTYSNFIPDLDVFAGYFLPNLEDLGDTSEFVHSPEVCCIIIMYSVLVS